jgi:hypothetical protein
MGEAVTVIKSSCCLCIGLPLFRLVGSSGIAKVGTYVVTIDVVGPSVRDNIASTPVEGGQTTCKVGAGDTFAGCRVGGCNAGSTVGTIAMVPVLGDCTFCAVGTGVAEVKFKAGLASNAVWPTNGPDATDDSCLVGTVTGIVVREFAMGAKLGGSVSGELGTVVGNIVGWVVVGVFLGEALGNIDSRFVVGDSLGTAVGKIEV